MISEWQYREGTLWPASEAAVALAAKFKNGQSVRADIKRMRSPRQLRMWWGMIGLIHEHQDTYATREDLSDAFKIWLGHCTEMRLKDGRAAVRAKSIAFGNMKQDSFNELMDAAIKLVCERIMPNTDDGDFRRQLESIIDR